MKISLHWCLRFFSIVTFLVLFLGVENIAEGGFGGHQSLRISKRDYIEVPLEKRGNAYFLNVTINDKETLFLLDTGATTTVLSYGDHAKYKMKNLKQRGVFRGIGGEVIGHAYKIKKFSVGELKVGAIKIWVVPSQYNSNMQDVEGILGEDILSKFDGFIDHASQRLFLKKPK